MIDEASLREVFPQNPIQEVAFEIRFPTNFRILRDISEIHDALRSTYTTARREPPDTPADPLAVNYVFSTESRDKTVKLREDRFSMLIRDYTSFEDFTSEVMRRSQQ